MLRKFYRFLAVLPLATVLPLVLLGALVVPIPAAGQCFINGNIDASDDSSQPELGAWEYTLTLDWDTGSTLGLHHLDILLDELSRRCSCGDLQMGVVPGDTVGLSTGEPGRCPVYYTHEFQCTGDPEVPADGKMLKFVPFPDQPCQPGSAGAATFTFFSDSGPAFIETSELFLVDEMEQFACSGAVTGLFPGLACDPLSKEKATWGCLKSHYGGTAARRP